MLAVVAVAGVAGYISYWHAVEVVTRHGETAVRGHLYPVVIDGIIVAASMVVLDAARHREARPLLAWWLLGAGIGVTLAANVTYGVTFGLAGALWAAWPALAFVGCYELLMMLVRASARRAQTGPAGTVPSPVPNAAETAARGLAARHARRWQPVVRQPARDTVPADPRRGDETTRSRARRDPTGTHPNQTHPTPHKPPAAGLRFLGPSPPLALSRGR